MKLKLTAIGTIVVLSLVGCGTRTIIVEVPAPTLPESTTSSTTSPAPENTQAPQMSASEKERRLVESVRDEYPALVREMGAAWVVELGYLVCNGIDEGLTMEDLALIVYNAGVAEFASEVGYIAGAAVYLFCPEHSGWVDGAGA